jgi:excinuclease UvrABC nuclease subunit
VSTASAEPAGIVVYRLLDHAGDLLYVGQTGDLLRRLRAHRREKEWWSEVRDVQTTPAESKDAAVEAERVAIQTEGPRYNLQLLPGYRMVVKSFRVPEPAWAAVVARAEREGLNPTEVVRELAIAWGKGDADE